MAVVYHLAEKIRGREYNIYTGTYKECDKEMKRLIRKGNSNPMYITQNRFN